MFEIHPHRRNVKKDMMQFIAVILGMEALLYLILVKFNAIVGGDIAFYLMSAVLMMVLIPVGVLGVLPQKFVIDSEAGEVRYCFKEKCLTNFKMSEIKEIEYGVGRKGHVFLNIYRKAEGIMSLSDWNFEETDIRSAFEKLSALSEKYGFDVKETYQSDTVVRSASGAPAAESIIEGNEELAPASGDLAPYKVK